MYYINTRSNRDKLIQLAVNIKYKCIDFFDLGYLFEVTVS